MNDRELCGAYWDGEDYLPQCQLAKGHDGDHVTTVSWPQYEPRPPRDPNEPVSPLVQALHTAWGTTIAHTLSTLPVIARSAVVSRDTESTSE